MKRFVWKCSFFYVAVLAVLAAVCGAFHQKKLTLWPAENRPQIYTDAREGGFSTAEFLAGDSAVGISAILNSGLYHPHAGVGFPLRSGLESLASGGVDFSSMDSVEITLRANADVVLVLYAMDPAVSKPGEPLSFRPLRMDVPATRAYSRTRLPLSMLEPGALWLDMHGLEQDGNLYLENILQVAVETGKGALLGLPTEIEIRQLEFFGTNRTLVRACLSILILATIIYTWSLVKYGKRIAKSKNAESGIGKR